MKIHALEDLSIPQKLTFDLSVDPGDGAVRDDVTAGEVPAVRERRHAVVRQVF